MVRIIPFKGWHLAALDLQEIQIGYLGTSSFALDLLDPEFQLALEQGGPAWTAHENGRVLCCAGFTRHPWELQAEAWSFLSASIGAAMTTITRAVRREIAAADFRRIEIFVRSDHFEGLRWARLLGLEREGTLRKWGPLGLDHEIFARVK